MSRLLRAGSRPSKLSRFGLCLLVHGEAMLRHPLSYLAARYWLLVGKRVKGRNRLSPLLGATRFAYATWIAEIEPNSWPELAGKGNDPRIIIVVDARVDPAKLPETLRSLVEERGSLSAILVLGEGPAIPGLDAFPAVVLAQPADLRPALEAEEDAWLLPLNAGDRLATGAVALFAEAAETGAPVCYADDDLLSESGARRYPHFKPGWNAELFRHHDFLSGAAIIRAGPDVFSAIEAADPADWIRAAAISAIAAATIPPRHIPHILVHRNARPEPVLPPKANLAEHGDWPTVSVIIPTRNQLPLLKACLAGLAATRYPIIECLIIDNGSDDSRTIRFLGELDKARFQVLEQPGPFNFAALNNLAVSKARGEYICLLNNDVSMIDPDWLAHLVRQAQRPEVGAVGARLLYPDGAVQHAGVVLGVGGGAAHAHRGLRPRQPGYFHRANLPQFVSAVTAACLVVAREKFLAAGGFDAAAFPVAFNDVDLCNRLNALGWQSFYEPRAELMHHESRSRGTDQTPENRERFAGELARLKERWQTDQQVDPFHHPALSRFSDTFVVGL